MKIIEGNLVAQELRMGIVAGRLYEFIISKLVSGAVNALKRHGEASEKIEVAYVLGAFKIPLVAKKMAESEKYDAIICLERFHTTF